MSKDVNFKYFILIIMIALFSINILSAQCPSADKSGSLIYYDSQAVDYLDSSIKSFEKELQKINSKTFEDRSDIHASTAISLIEETQALLRYMAVIKSATKKIRKKADCNKTPDTLNEWVIIARNISKSAGYIYDLEYFRLIDTQKCFSCELMTLRLGQAFDFIEARIKNEPVIF